jgi:hypothetical protein
MKYLVGFISGALLMSFALNYQTPASAEVSINKTKERIWVASQKKNG